ncbi:hypothetical protein TNCV_735441 [Trichonephila clavipes]|uniref:DUF5641 domain-containing protein n=1 Tax=Trichonephila clavipes TaxID=2585209 RepID=A0A8X6SSB3_TRICX|nr:hypothetical protein TNCV_735441 [Trichonephila clavipes]
MAPKELSELTVFNRRKAHLLGQITRIRNSLENVDSPLRKPNFTGGTLVLIKDENVPSTKWSTGRITEIFPGTDGKVRVVNLRMPNGNI